MMKFNTVELNKLFDYILINKAITLTDNGIFSRDTLIILRDIIKGKRPNDFELTEIQELALKNAFLKGNCIFDENTPAFIISNEKCITAAINRDINSVDYINDPNQELIEKILKVAPTQGYILKRTSPDYLRMDYNVALNSIKYNVNSANYIIWKDKTEEQKNSLVNEIINRGYLLSTSSSRWLKTNPDIVLSSISIDIQTLAYADRLARNDSKVVKYLINHGYDFTKEELLSKPLATFNDYEVMRYALAKNECSKENYNYMELFKYKEGSVEENASKYADRYADLVVSAINTPPTIASFKPVLEAFAEFQWIDYRHEHVNNYANIFSKICASLKNNNNYSDVFKELPFLKEMQKVLDDKFALLQKAMYEYHTVIHKKLPISNLNDARDGIAKLSALYVAISKESYKKQLIEDSFYPGIQEFFIPRKDHPVVRKKILEHQYKDKFEDLYHRDDLEISNFIASIIKQYSKTIDSSIVTKMIDNFVVERYSKLDEFIKAPSGFNNYKRYLEASKLINRLNSKYIKYTDQELNRYLDIIKFDDEQNKYIYVGPVFTNEQVNRYNDYFDKQHIFEKIKAQIILKAKKLKIDTNIYADDLTDISEDLPFNDEYFEFDKQNYFETFELSNIFEEFISEHIEPDSLLDDEAYKLLKSHIIKNGLFWLILIEACINIFEECAVDKDYLTWSFDYMSDVVKLAKNHNYNLNKFEDVMALCELGAAADEQSIAILGEDIILKLCKYDGYTGGDTEEIVRIAKELYSKMVTRDKSTVPYVSGHTENYLYSMYDSQDETILLAGIDTDACFRVDGNDNDFLHYCALDKNGFVIKITDVLGNFVGRAAGFRNGNCVYINQLRTVLDNGGNNYSGEYEAELAEIIEAFKNACIDIVCTSQNNLDERNKIDFVFVTQSYALNGTPSNVSGEVMCKIGDYPMDASSQDWKDFVQNTDNLQENNCDGFKTDYGNYSLICAASIKDFSKIKPRDIKPKDVPAVYTRTRNKIVITDNLDDTIINKINCINAIYSNLTLNDFKMAVLPQNAIVITGDNWYLAINQGQIISECAILNDKKAVLELKATKEVLGEIKENDNSAIYTKVLKAITNRKY